MTLLKRDRLSLLSGAMIGRGKGVKGLGKGGAKPLQRHRIIVRDAIRGLTNPAIRRLQQTHLRGDSPRLQGVPG